MTRGSKGASLTAGAILEAAEYDARVDGEYVTTDRRPTAAELLSIVRWLLDTWKQVHAHKPGDGWHFLPGPPEISYNGAYWFGTYPTSEGAILAQVVDICQATGVASTASTVRRIATRVRKRRRSPLRSAPDVSVWPRPRTSARCWPIWRM